MKPCIICGNTNLTLFHKGVRDNKDIDVLKCEKCGMFQLSSFDFSQVVNYADGEMRKCNYNVVKEEYTQIDWDSWQEITRKDDERRAEALKDLCRGKRVCEFGCGNGGFLRRIKKYASEVIGIEVDKECINRLNEEGLTVVDRITDYIETFDVVVMFHVIEHLSEPQSYLKQIWNSLTNERGGGVCVCETCNSQDALISLYECEKFKNFTYWSEHVYLYNSDTLEKLINSCGFKTLKNDQIQRYELSNHLYWLAKGLPGGHKKWIDFNNKSLNELYEEVLKKNGQCDTLFSYFKKEAM